MPDTDCPQCGCNDTVTDKRKSPGGLMDWGDSRHYLYCICRHCRHRFRMEIPSEAEEIDRNRPDIDISAR